MHYSFAFAAIIGGSLRLVTEFASSALPSSWLPGMYTGIDLCLILGLVGSYWQAGMPRSSGLFHWGFVIALCGLAFIAGPEASFYGHGAYAIGTPLIGAGLVLWSLPQLISGGNRPAAACFLSSVALSVAVMAGLHIAHALTLSYSLFAIGFILLGLGMLRR